MLDEPRRAAPDGPVEGAKASGDHLVQPRRGRIATPARRNSRASVRVCTPNSAAATANEAPSRYRAAARVTVSSVILRTTRRRAMSTWSRWWITVVRWIPYRRASPSIDAPSRYRWISCWISARGSRRCTGFESRPQRSTRCRRHNVCAGQGADRVSDRSGTLLFSSTLRRARRRAVVLTPELLQRGLAESSIRTPLLRAARGSRPITSTAVSIRQRCWVTQMTWGSDRWCGLPAPGPRGSPDGRARSSPSPVRGSTFP